MALSTGTSRTLTQMLRMWDDTALADLLIARPDLAFPPPSGLSDVASRATTRHSVSCAVDSLNAFELEVARRASGLGHGFTVADLAAGFSDREPVELTSEVGSAVQRLRALALVWGGASQLRPVRALAAVVFPGSSEASPHTGGGGVAPPARPPEFGDAARQPIPLVDKVAAGSAFELIRRVEVLLEHCAVQPVQLRRDGVIATREVRGVCRLLDVPAASATLHLQLAESAGLLGVAAVGGSEVLAPAKEFEAWQELTPAAQWAAMALAWRDAHSASGPAWLKQLCLAAFGDPLEGRVLPAGAVRSWLAWQRPRHVAVIDRKTAGILQHATEIGLLGLGAVASFAPTLDVPALGVHLPARTDKILLQADLTAIAPGPLTASAARELSALADIESRGGATVYRFSPATLQRGLASGWDGEAVLAMLQRRSRTPVPQPLAYLVRDAARRTGGEGNAVGSVAASAEPGPHLRGVARKPSSDPPATPRLGRRDALAIVEAVRAAEEGAEGVEFTEGRPAGQVARLALDTLREAVETGESVWYSSVDDQGRATERVVRAESVDSGALAGVESTSGERVVVAVSRITAAHILRRSS